METNEEPTEKEALEAYRLYDEILATTVANVADMAQELRKHQKNAVLHFGKGDLALGAKFSRDKKSVGVIIVDAQGPDKSIGSTRDYTTKEQLEGIKAIWRFANTQSIDVVIAKLQDARKLLETLEGGSCA